jgi:hypothetical protein
MAVSSGIRLIVTVGARARRHKKAALLGAARVDRQQMTPIIAAAPVGARGDVGLQCQSSSSWALYGDGICQSQQD